MSMVLAEGQISRIEDCIHRDLLTYVSYPLFEGASRCFAYPQFLVEDDSLTLLEDSAFPDNGCLPMIASRTTPRDLLDMFGNIVVMRVNDEHPNRNHNYPENESARYNSIIDPFFTRGASSVEFMPLSKHALSGSLIQVIDVQEIVDLTYPSQNPVHVYSAAALPQTKLVAIAQGKQGQRKLYVRLKQPALRVPVYSFMRAILTVCASVCLTRMFSRFPSTLSMMRTIW